MISVITVINNHNIYNNGLIKSLRADIESKDIEIIEINNENNSNYNDLAIAYNKGVLRANGEWICIAHPDIYLNQSLHSVVQYAEKIIQQCKDIVILGVAGVEHNGESLTCIEQGEKRERSENHFNGREYVEVQTIDACFFVAKKDTLEEYGFNSAIHGFHLIIEELCLRIVEDDKKVAVIPIDLWHFSKGGSLDWTYYRNARKILKFHPDLKYLYTTSFQWKVSRFLKYKLIYYEVRNIIHHKIIRFISK